MREQSLQSWCGQSGYFMAWALAGARTHVVLAGR